MTHVQGVSIGTVDSARDLSAFSFRSKKLAARRSSVQPAPSDTLTIGGRAASAPGLDARQAAALTARARLVAALSGKLSERPPQHLGDVDGDGKLGRSDAEALADYLFRGGEAPEGLANADVNQDGRVDVADVARLGVMIAEREAKQPE